MNKQSLVISVVIVAVLWSALSWYWYVCGIKGFCEASLYSTNTSDEVQSRETDSVNGNSSRSDRNTSTEGTVVSTEELTIQCESYLDSYIRKGYNNVEADVVRLQTYLNTYENESLDVDGSFGTLDEEAVKRFQLKYRKAVMNPWGMTQPSGYVFKTTRDHINTLKCALDYASEGAEIQVES